MMIIAFIYLSFESIIHLSRGIWMKWKQFHFKDLAGDSAISHIA